MMAIMFVYAIFAGLVILVIVGIMLAYGLSAAIGVCRRVFGKKKIQPPAHSDSRPIPTDHPRA